MKKMELWETVCDDCYHHKHKSWDRGFYCSHRLATHYHKDNLCDYYIPQKRREHMMLWAQIMLLVAMVASIVGIALWQVFIAPIKF